ncbi:catalase [Streptomyces sp. NRRL F-2580]|uniref:catalase n=1 Tax=Streptomyces sp. NRRL F-2580 TaxID=1463841 RepID=UPI0004CA4EAE|nr:catalase [Streptomyces sp. NRRL F-2580]
MTKQQSTADTAKNELPGKPGPESPPLSEPTEPTEPLPPKPDQDGPETVGPTGQATGAEQARVAQSGAYLTTAQGTRLPDTDHSLKAGPRGPVLLQDHHLRERITHFDHERIPERVVHARGAAAHGVFQGYGTAGDIIHAGKPHPDREIPQAQSAHDTFWDFVSLHTEATHHTLWNMSDRGIPRSYRMMEGFGVHTFRLVNAADESVLVKFHWKPKLGVHSLVWEEAQLINGMDPDFHRRDLFDAIESGAFPQWELGIQVFPDTPEQTFEGIDLLDPTKIVPEELSPVQPIGLMTLNANTKNYFAETEQVAFHPGHLVPGIDVTDDPLLAGRLFSYLDTQISRLGGPNFGQIPINRPHTPVNDMLRDGMHQTAVHTGVAPYHPNSLDGGCPFLAGADTAAFTETPVKVPAASKVREAPASFSDHFTQPRLFWLSMTPPEREHIIAAYTFELNKCYEQAIKERTLQVLANIDPQLCEQVATGLGLPAPAATEPLAEPNPSPALSQTGRTWPTDGRVIGIIADPACDLDGVRDARQAILDTGMMPLVIAPTGGTLHPDGGDPITIQRTFTTARSVEFDALLLAGVPQAGADAYGARDAKAGTAQPPQAPDPRVLLLVTEAHRHGKAIGGWNGAERLLESAGITAHEPGIAVADSGSAVVAALASALAEHRAWDRFPAAL